MTKICILLPGVPGSGRRYTSQRIAEALEVPWLELSVGEALPLKQRESSAQGKQKAHSKPIVLCRLRENDDTFNGLGEWLFSLLRSQITGVFVAVDEDDSPWRERLDADILSRVALVVKLPSIKKMKGDSLQAILGAESTPAPLDHKAKVLLQKILGNLRTSAKNLDADLRLRIPRLVAG